MENNKFRCTICNKLYKTYQSLWNHKNKYHPKTMTILLPNNDQCMTILSQNNNQNMTSDKITKIKKTDNTICEYCNKEYSAYTHLKRHQKICENKLQKKEDIEKIKEEHNKLQEDHEEVKKQIVELKAQLLQVMNDKYKMHPKTFNKINNDIANNTNSNNNITINNINYVEYGNENLHEIFTPQEAIKLPTIGYIMDITH